jgi:hypothetical protein
MLQAKRSWVFFLELAKIINSQTQGSYQAISAFLSYGEVAISTMRKSALTTVITSTIKKKKLHGLSPRANYTDRATAACRQSDCQLLWIEGAT